MLLEELGTRIRDARMKLGLTQNDVAGALQVSPQAVSKWERGENAPDITLIPELSRLLSVSSDRLLGTHIPSKRTVEATVCMSDIKGFTRAASHQSPEDLATMINAHFLQLTEIVLKYDGVPVKYMGDAFLYFFAGPEHRLRAVKSAVNAAKLPGFEVSIGMSSGPIFVGKVGHPDYARMDIMGDYVNLAARTQSWAGGTESLIAASDATVEEIKDQLVFGTIEEQKIKGLDIMVLLYEIKDVSG